MFKSGFLALLMCLAIGCTNAPVESVLNTDLASNRSEFSVAPFNFNGATVHGGHLDTSLGDVKDASGYVTRVDTMDDGRVSSLALTLEASKVSMVVLEFNRSFQDEFFTPGTSIVFDTQQAPLNSLHVGGLGCSGLALGMWDFDESPHTIAINVKEGPRDTTMISFDMGFDNQDDHATGHFLIER